MKSLAVVNSLRGGFLPRPEEVFELSANAINMAGGSMLVVACLVAIADAVQLKLKLKKSVSLDSIKLELGQAIIFALELLVAADVIETLTKSAHSYHIETLYKIMAIVVIRTTLAYFLGKEVVELEHKLAKQAKKNH
jgi:hypothetical protein